MATQATRGREVQVEVAEASLLDKALEETALRLDTVASNCASAIGAATGHMHRALITARGIQRLRETLTTKVMTEIIPLMNTPLGFLTDRGPQAKSEAMRTPYATEIVRDCFIESLLLGLKPTGNEWNIISGRCYVTLPGWKRKLEMIPGISDIKLAPGVPTVHNGQRVVRVALSWKLHGKGDRLVGPDGKDGIPFAVIGYDNSTPDFLIGKAKRKAYKAAFEQATGSECTTPDGEVGEPQETLLRPSRTQTVEERLGIPTNGHKALLDDIRSRCADLPADEVEVLATKVSAGRTGDVGALTKEEAELFLQELTRSE